MKVENNTPVINVGGGTTNPEKPPREVKGESFAQQLTEAKANTGSETINVGGGTTNPDKPVRN